MIEKEAKIEINEAEEKFILRQLKNPDFFIQHNEFFEINGKIIRLREEKGQTILNIKGERLENKFNAREEVECYISNKDFIDKLDLKKLFEYTKKRVEALLFNCVISVDILEDGSRFVEIEGNEEEIKNFLGKFNFLDREIRRESYFEILSKKEEMKGGDKNGISRSSC